MQPGPLADARELQQLGRIEGASAEHDLAATQALKLPFAPLPPHHSYHPPSIERQASDMKPGHHLEAGWPLSSPQEGACAALTQAPFNGCLEVADALLNGAVEVVVSGKASLLGGSNEGIAYRQPTGYGVDRESPLTAVVVALSTPMAFRATKQRQHFVI